MEINQLRTFYRKFGGLKAIRFFAKRGLLWPMAKKVLSNPFNRHSYMDAYYVAVRDVETLLREKYLPLMNEQKAYYSTQDLKHEKSKKVWFCWLQGIEHAPLEVRICYSSLLKHLTDREIKLIDGNNWAGYVDLPDSIIKRWEKKQISPAHFSDLIRLQLLIRYGGTWIDANVLCTGITPQNEDATRSYLDSDLFMFQYRRPGSDQWGGIGNWFITACTNNEVLMVLRDMLYAYWTDFDFIVDYYVFHLFFSMLREVYPEKIDSMPFGYAPRSLTLVHHWGELFDEERWERLTSRVCFHMITSSVSKDVLKEKDNYYHYVVNSV